MDLFELEEGSGFGDGGGEGVGRWGEVGWGGDGLGYYGHGVGREEE